MTLMRAVTELAVGAGGVGSSSVGVEPWFIATLVVLTTAAIIFVVVVFTICFCRRRDLAMRPGKSTYRGPGSNSIYTHSYHTSTSCFDVSFICSYYHVYFLKYTSCSQSLICIDRLLCLLRYRYVIISSDAFRNLKMAGAVDMIFLNKDSNV